LFQMIQQDTGALGAFMLEDGDRSHRQGTGAGRSVVEETSM